MQKTIDFISTTGKPVMISLIEGGHTISIGTEPTPTPPKFHAAAMASGCVPAIMADAYRDDTDKAAKNVSPDRGDILKAVIQKMVNEASNDAIAAQKLFDVHGRPKTHALSARVGFTVPATERDAVWDEFTAEREE